MTALHLEVHYGVDLASVGTPLHDACAALVELGFGPEARVLSYERDRTAVAIDLRDATTAHAAVVEKGCARGPLFHSLQAGSTASESRRFGTVMVRGRLARTWLGIRFDEYVPAMPIGNRWLFSNSVSFTTENSRIAARPSHEWARELFVELARSPDVLWGAAWHDDEYRASNLHDEADGMWALGRDVRRSLPGLFWLNAFGRAYTDLIGTSTLASAPTRVLDVGPSVVVEVYPSPAEWRGDASRRAHDAVLAHIGRQFFYERSSPDRATVAPDFGLPELPDREAFQVLSFDGETFTVLPNSDE